MWEFFSTSLSVALVGICLLLEIHKPEIFNKKMEAEKKGKKWILNFSAGTFIQLIKLITSHLPFDP